MIQAHFSNAFDLTAQIQNDPLDPISISGDLAEQYSVVFIHFGARLAGPLTAMPLVPLHQEQHRQPAEARAIDPVGSFAGKILCSATDACFATPLQ